MVMEKNWYYLDPTKPQGEQRIGPLEKVQMEELLQAGSLTLQHLVWNPDHITWLPLGDVLPQRSPEKQNLDNPDEAIELPMVEVQATEERAGLGVRITATLIDILILFGLNAILLYLYTHFFGVPLHVYEESLALRIPGFLLEMAFQVYFLGSAGATPGKKVMGLRVVREDGTALDYSKGFELYWAYLLTALTLGIGFFLLLGDPQKRALQDRVTKTKVLQIRA